jgi:hypothetical protein
LSELETLRARVAELESAIRTYEKTMLERFPGDGWQPIETAPRDGAHFIAAAVGGGRDFIIEAWFQDGAFRTVLDEFEVNSAAVLTHWMPLPNPPED